jgi:hypothetical protein
VGDLGRRNPRFIRGDVVQHAYAGLSDFWLPQGQPLTDEQLSQLWGHRTFKVLPRRWVVERTFAWLSLQRRLSIDYELLPQTSQAFIHLAMTRIMLRRLASCSGLPAP